LPKAGEIKNKEDIENEGDIKKRIKKLQVDLNN
jgi:hypothetical protein